MVFAIAEGFGIMLSSVVIKHFSMPILMLVSIVALLSLNFLIKFFNLSAETTLILFLIEAMIVGGFFNLMCVIQNTLIDPRYVSMCMEINFCMGFTTTMFGPIVAKLPEPFPTIYISAVGVIVLCVLPTLRKLNSTQPAKPRLDSFKQGPL